LRAGERRERRSSRPPRVNARSNGMESLATKSDAIPVKLVLAKAGNGDLVRCRFCRLPDTRFRRYFVRRCFHPAKAIRLLRSQG